MEIENRSDIETVRRSFARGWITDDATRISLRQQLEKIALDPTASAREKTSALKALLAAERLSLTEREVELKERTAGVLGDEEGVVALLKYIEVGRRMITDDSV